MNRPQKTIFAILLFFAIACTLPKGNLFSGETELPIVRVAILKGAGDFRLTIWKPYEVAALKTNEAIEKLSFCRDKLVTPTSSGIKIGDRQYKLFGVKIRALDGSNIYVNGRAFRGDIDIICQKDMTFLVVNRINVEEYLYGVLYHEISHKWPIEIIKAQAVAARTYALYQALLNKDKDYDLTSDIYSQMYGGKTSEKYTAVKAVDDTKGIVLTYKGKLFPSYYHATCAGKTEDAKNLWNIDLAPLKGVKCNFCKKSKHFYWHKRIPKKDLTEKLTEAGYDTSGVEYIKIISLNNSGRIDTIVIKAGESDIKLSGKDFRQILGPNFIRSNNFMVQNRGDDIYLKGLGWGHGVGLCQWGAYAMSQEGYNYQQILKYYYPDSKLARIKVE